MEKAKEFIKELQASCSETSQEEKLMDNLKPAINNLLHMYLPEDITIKECEVLAMVINDMIWNPRNYI